MISVRLRELSCMGATAFRARSGTSSSRRHASPARRSDASRRFDHVNAAWRAVPDSCRKRIERKARASRAVDLLARLGSFKEIDSRPFAHDHEPIPTRPSPHVRERCERVRHTRLLGLCATRFGPSRVRRANETGFGSYRVPRNAPRQVLRAAEVIHTVDKPHRVITGAKASRTLPSDGSTFHCAGGAEPGTPKEVNL